MTNAIWKTVCIAAWPAGYASSPSTCGNNDPRAAVAGEPTSWTATRSRTTSSSGRFGTAISATNPARATSQTIITARRG